MKLDYLDKIRDKDRLVTAALLGVSVVLAFLTVAKVGDYFVGSARAGSVIGRALERAGAGGDDIEQHLAASAAAAEDLKKKNVFAPPEPKRHPVTAVTGILGDEALIDGRWYKAGASIGDAKIVAVEPTVVRIEWQGGVKVFAPIMAAVPAAPVAVHSAEVRPEKQKKDKHEKAHHVTNVVKKQLAESLASGRDDSLDWIGVEVPAKLKAKILEKWSKASPAEREEAKRRWIAMPDEQKRMVIRQFDQMN